MPQKVRAERCLRQAAPGDGLGVSDRPEAESRSAAAASSGGTTMGACGTTRGCLATLRHRASTRIAMARDRHPGGRTAPGCPLFCIAGPLSRNPRIHDAGRGGRRSGEGPYRGVSPEMAVLGHRDGDPGSDAPSPRRLARCRVPFGADGVRRPGIRTTSSESPGTSSVSFGTVETRAGPRSFLGTPRGPADAIFQKLLGRFRGTRGSRWVKETGRGSGVAAPRIIDKLLRCRRDRGRDPRCRIDSRFRHWMRTAKACGRITATFRDRGVAATRAR